MKNTLMLLFATAISAIAEPVTFGWGPADPDEFVTSYTFYIGEETGVYTSTQDATPEDFSNPRKTIDLPAGIHYVTVTASNAYGESDKSNEVRAIVLPPSAPGDVKVIIEVQASSDMKEWRPLAAVWDENKQQQYYRLKPRKQ